MQIKRLLFSFFVFVLLCGGPLFAQSLNTSRIGGVVQDPTGAGVPGATVVLTQTDIGTTRTVQTAADGSYTATDLPLGPYKIQVTTQGFQIFTITGIVLQVGSNADVDVNLAIGSVNDVINVETSSGVSVETVSNGVGQVIDRTQVVELPLNGRDPTQLIALAGATTPAPAGDLNTNKIFPRSPLLSPAVWQMVSPMCWMAAITMTSSTT